MQIELTYGNGSDETDAGLGYIYSTLWFDTFAKKIDWDILCYDQRYGCPESERPEDVLKFIVNNYERFHESDGTINCICDLLRNDWEI